MAITPTGEVFPCLDLLVSLGNIKKEPLQSIVSKRKDFLMGFDPKKILKCVSCSIRDYCDSCIGAAILENGDYRVPFSHKCDVSHLYML